MVNPANSRSVIVTINDRCRGREELFFDLSREAARRLGILRQGRATVRIFLLEEKEPPVESPDGEEADAKSD